MGHTMFSVSIVQFVKGKLTVTTSEDLQKPGFGSGVSGLA